MTKFFVMRECDNILSGYLCAVTTVLSHQDGIYGFKFPKRFFEISSQEISLFSQLFKFLKRFLEISCRDLTLLTLFSLYLN